MLVAHGKLTETVEEMHAIIEAGNRKRLYWAAAHCSSVFSEIVPLRQTERARYEAGYEPGSLLTHVLTCRRSLPDMLKRTFLQLHEESSAKLNQNQEGLQLARDGNKPGV
jgi:hypothetical protein